MHHPVLVFIFNKNVNLTIPHNSAGLFDPANNSPTQVSTRFTDQVQTKEPVGNYICMLAWYGTTEVINSDIFYPLTYVFLKYLEYYW